MPGAGIFRRRRNGGLRQASSAGLALSAVGFCLALGVAGAHAAQGPTSPLIQIVANQSHPIKDLGVLPTSSDADNATDTLAAGSAVSGAQPVPELPIWAMLLVFFAGLGLARVKRGRKDRLSPGLE